MIRDIVRTALAILTMTIGAGLAIEARYHFAAIDVAHRAALGQQIAQHQATAMQPPGRLRQFGRASLELADAAIGLVR